MKSVVSSFDVDHRTLREGLYLRSTYQIDDKLSVLSWDMRFCAPMDHKPLTPGAVHTIEHLMAYWLRLDETIGHNIVSFCPMGCLTGFYLSTMNDVTAKQITLNKTELGMLLGMNEIQCGNPSLYDIEGANEAMHKYIGILLSPEEAVAAGLKL